MNGMKSHHYNPDWLDDDALVAGFIARQNEFAFLRDELARAPRVGSVQHYLLVGQRGAGKTTLLKRLAVAIRRDEDLRDHLIALSFPEELYQVKQLEDFWWAACEALADELDRLGQPEPAQRLFEEVDRSRASGASAEPQAGLERLLAACAELQRRPVLLVDNLDFIFQRIDKQGRKRKDPLSPTYWALREALSTTTSPIVVGGSVRLSEPFTDYDKAFYDFFITKRLARLSLEEVRRMLEHQAERQGLPEVKTRLHARPARIEALYELTGGNPRAIGLIFELLKQGPNGHAVDDFERLMDLTTPYYKHRFEDLPEQAQVVMHALAVRRPGEGGGPGSSLRFGHTAAEIGAHAGLPTNIVSAQMDVLEREGLIEKSAAHGRTQYRIAEQLFRLWLQMRGTRRVRQSVIGLAEFLEAMFDMEELTAQLNASGGLAGARLAFAVADTNAAAPLRHGLEAHGADCLLRHAGGDDGELGELLHPGDLPADLEALVQLRTRLQQYRGGGLDAGELDALLGSLELTLEQKRTAVEALCAPDSAPAEAARLRQYLHGERARLLSRGLREGDLPLLYRLRAKGQLPLPWLTPGDADSAMQTQAEAGLAAMLWRLVGAREHVKFADEASANAWLEWGKRHAREATSTEWANVAGSLRRSRQYALAGKVLEFAFEHGESARAWYERGALVSACNGSAEEEEAAFRKASELDPLDAWPWTGLGFLLADKLGRPEEAESAYHKSIGLDPAFSRPWNNLGNLLANQLARPAEAEAAYRKAIELDPTLARPWHGLGILLADKLARPEEAESAFRKAIELDPTLARPWHGLGILFADKLARPKEAESAFRKAIELDPTLARPWHGLGILFADKLARPKEAESAFRKAIELDPTLARPWNGLGVLLADKLARPAEAEAAYRKAIELDSSYGTPWGNLGLLLAGQSRLDEADGAFAKAAELDTKNATYWRSQQRRMATRRRAAETGKALKLGDLAALRATLTSLLGQPKDLAATLASGPFIEEVLVPALADPHKAPAVLGLLWGLGFDRHARPLLLAFEAALEKRPESLDELEPEVRDAARRMYQRLLAGSKQTGE